MPVTVKQNDRLVLSERPKRGPITNKTFRREKVQLGELADGQVLVRVDYVSIVRRCTGRECRVELSAGSYDAELAQPVEVVSPSCGNWRGDASGRSGAGGGFKSAWSGRGRSCASVSQMWTGLMIGIRDSWLARVLGRTAQSAPASRVGVWTSREIMAYGRLPAGARDIDYLGFLGTSGESSPLPHIPAKSQV